MYSIDQFLDERISSDDLKAVAVAASCAALSRDAHSTGYSIAAAAADAAYYAADAVAGECEAEFFKALSLQADMIRQKFTLEEVKERLNNEF